MGDAGGIAAGEEKKASSSSGILRVVWFRQMLRRWQSSSSRSATGDGDRAEPNPSASTDERSSAGTAPAAAPAHQHEHRNPAASERRPLPRVVVVEERGCGRGRKCPAAAEGAGSPMTPVTPDSPADVPRGCCHDRRDEDE